MKRLAFKLITIYQKTLSFDHGPLKARFPQGFCRFHPTCSEYAYRAIEKHGLFRGGFMGIYRVLRCNPFSKGGHDSVPPLNRREINTRKGREVFASVLRNVLR